MLSARIRFQDLQLVPWTGHGHMRMCADSSTGRSNCSRLWGPLSTRMSQVCCIHTAAGLAEVELDMSDMPPMLLNAYLLYQSGALTDQHLLWQAFEMMLQSAVGEYDASRDLRAKYNNMCEYMMTINFHFGGGMVNLLNGIGGTGMGRGATLLPVEFFKRHNLTNVSLRTLKQKQPVPELAGGISFSLLFRYLETCRVSTCLLYCRLRGFACWVEHASVICHALTHPLSPCPAFIIGDGVVDAAC